MLLLISVIWPARFLPTPSARRATLTEIMVRPSISISTHALREEGDEIAPQWTYAYIDISTHALREEGDGIHSDRAFKAGQFLPTPSARRATPLLCMSLHKVPISTHALREEGDWAEIVPLNADDPFLPTPSARRATANVPENKGYFLAAFVQ